ncbi:YheC/YheD family protein [Acaryochloris sp. IP29b_bin.137]|uniref:ATP-grasp domain-containing protein n=1 Tax=Acaryochloris sp. IP29b_bin.137 TaxID=2969217 RepID=UPI00262CB5E5|nr:YheC/YheD family protein [Acaryochloris sp. IP29b_bin.137]
MIKLLCICDPSLYTSPQQDVPTTYIHFAQHPQIQLFHAPAEWVNDPQQVLAVQVPQSLTYPEFLQLDTLPQSTYSLAEFDLVFCRRLKPFPPGYLDILGQWSRQTQFLNHPIRKQEQMQPDFLSKIAGPYIPHTLVTSEVEQAQSFFQQHQMIVAKRANSCGGRGVFKIWQDANQFWVDNSLTGTHGFPTFQSVMGYLQGNVSEPLQFVRYLQKVTAGDKRVVVVNGEIYGAYLRRSRTGYWVNNVSVDGDCTLAEIMPEEQEAIANTVGAYSERGLHTLGYDFLLDDDGTWKISEINVGNIGGFARLQALTGEPICDRLTDWMLEYARTPKFSEL